MLNLAIKISEVQGLIFFLLRSLNVQLNRTEIQFNYKVKTSHEKASVMSQSPVTVQRTIYFICYLTIYVHLLVQYRFPNMRTMRSLWRLMKKSPVGTFARLR